MYVKVKLSVLIGCLRFICSKIRVTVSSFYSMKTKKYSILFGKPV